MGLFNSIRLGSSGAGDYEVKHSIRNDQGTSDTNSGSNFSRTFGASGNRKTFTKSVWVKKCNTPGNISDDQYSIISAGGGGSGSSACNLRFSNIDTLKYGSGASGSSIFKLWTNRKFRDPSAWYHIVVAVDTTQSTASDRAKMYINGVQETDFATADYPSQNADIYFNFDINHRIGSNSLWSDLNSTYGNFNGYIAEFNFIDGTALTPSSFGETDELTGQWKPKKYAGSYGTNGFYLNFSDNSNTTAATLGKDSSGNGNNFTPNNFATGDAVKDSPTNNFCTLNLLNSQNTNLSEGNLKGEITNATGNRTTVATMGVRSGKWYYEVLYNSQSSDSVVIGFGDESYNALQGNNKLFEDHTPSIGYRGNNNIYNNTSTSSTSTTFTSGDIIGVAADLDNNQIYFYKNGTVNSNANPFSYTFSDTIFIPAITNLTSGGNQTITANFGQDSTFAGAKTAQGNADGNGKGDFYYAVPSGFKAICSANLPDPSIALPDKHFDTLLWSGNATTSDRSITGLNFKPDFVWTKTRNHGYHHALFDSVRGASNRLFTDQNFVENHASGGALASFDNDGITWDYGTGNEWWNESGKNYVAWNWKGGGTASSNSDGGITSSVSANTSAGFSIVTYTGTGSQTTVGHGLGVKPKFILTKLRDTNTQDWMLYPKQITGNGATYIKFNTSDGPASDAHTYPNVEPTSTVYTVGGDDGGDGTNGNGKAYVAYCFSEVANYSKFGIYKGNGTTDGSFVFTGFSPAMIWYWKLSGENRHILDTTRDPLNPNTLGIDINRDAAAADDSNLALDLLSNGFKLRTSHSTGNSDGVDYIYFVWAESPFKYSRAR